MHIETIIVVLFALATAVSLAARWLRVPYTVALVVTGLALGATHVFEPPNLTKELLYAVFLPGLLFEAAFHLDYKKFAQNRLTIFSLAVPGVAVAITLTALFLTPSANALHFVENFSLSEGLVFAALISATDPIAVVGLFKSLGAPKRLAIIVEGESLLNDGTAVVAFTLILAAVSGGDVSAGSATLDFVRIVGMGLLIGVVFGYGLSRVTHLIEDPMVEITLTTIAAYGSFVVAEQFHFSGVIATVTAGMFCGNMGARTGMSPTTRISVESFWEYLAFALNSVVFLLIGFAVPVEALMASIVPILVAFTAVTLGRATVVYSVGLLLRRTREKVPLAWLAVFTWGGLRGGLSMVLVLGLDATFPHRGFLLTLTYGVVVVSILVQGMTMTPLLRWLGLVGSKSERIEYEVHRGELRAARAALVALDKMVADGTVHEESVRALRAEYEARRGRAASDVEQHHLRAAELLEEEQRVARRHLIQVEKQSVIADGLKGLVGTEAQDQLRRDIDARLYGLETGETRPEAPSPTPSEASSSSASSSG